MFLFMFIKVFEREETLGYSRKQKVEGFNFTIFISNNISSKLLKGKQTFGFFFMRFNLSRSLFMQLSMFFVFCVFYDLF